MRVDNDNIRVIEKKQGLLYYLCFILMSYITILIFCPYVGSHFLTFIPFTFLLVFFAMCSICRKRVLELKSFITIVMVLSFLAWFYLCLSNNTHMNSYKSMILSISITLISAILYFEVFDCDIIGKIIGVLVVSAIVTILISIPYVNDNYLIVRSLSTGGTEIDKTLGIGGYDFIYSLSFLCPVILLAIKVTKGWIRTGLIFVLALTIIYSSTCGLTITIITSIFGILFYCVFRIKKDKLRKYTLTIIVFLGVFLLLFGSGILTSFFSWLAENSNQTIIKEKSNDIALALSGASEQYGTISGRLIRYRISLNLFFSSPLWGGFLFADSAQIGGHSTLFDYFALTGIIGAGLYLGTLVRIYMRIAKRLSNKLTKCILWEVFFIYLIISIIKNVSYASIVWTVFLLAPSIVLWADRRIPKEI